MDPGTCRDCQLLRTAGLATTGTVCQAREAPGKPDEDNIRASHRTRKKLEEKACLFDWIQ